MQRLIGTCLLLLSIAGCSSLNVHLYTKHLNSSEVNQVSQLLEQQGLRVVPNELDFPNDIDSSTIIFSPFVENAEAIDTLVTVLDTNGWNIGTVNSLVTGNHWYRKNDIALLLIPDRLQKDGQFSLKNIANSYSSNNCDSSIKLVLKSDNTYQFDINQSQDKEGFSVGKWAFTLYPYVELVSENKSYYFYFKVEHSTTFDNIGKINTTELVPEKDYRFFPNCSFLHGVRV